MRWYGRLRRSSEIAFVRRTGRRAGTATLSAYAADAMPGTDRLAIAVSKTVGGAVVRNLIRRRVRGALDEAGRPARPLRLLFVAKPAAASESYARLAADVAGLLRRLDPGS